MSKEHSRLIIFLLAGILAVLLFGREAMQGSLEVVFWIGLALGIVALAIWGIVALVRGVGREVKVYRQEVRRDREEGRPWLHTFIAWPGIIGNFLVIGVAAYSRYVEESCSALLGDCLQQIPYWWLPVVLLLGSMPIAGLERIILHYRNRDA